MTSEVCRANCEFHVCCEIDLRGENGSGVEAVQSLFRKEDRDAETRMLHDPGLNFIIESR